MGVSVRKRQRAGEDVEGFRAFLDLTPSVEIKVWFGLFSSIKLSKTYNQDYGPCGLGLNAGSCVERVWFPPVLLRTFWKL